MTRTQGNKGLWLAAMRADGPAIQAAFEEAASREEGLSIPVPSCPGWTMLDLVHHLAAMYRSVRSHVNRGVTSRPESTDDATKKEDLPTGAAAIQWWIDEFEALLALLDALDPQMPAWNWAPQSKQVSFWQRRMAHETSIHRWDAQTAVGRTEPIDTKLAADGISEVLDTWLPAGRRRGPEDRSGVVQLTATDIGQDWFVRLRGPGVALLDTSTWLDHDDHHARALARGTASDLNLALFGRIPFDVLEVSGDASLLSALRTG